MDATVERVVTDFEHYIVVHYGNGSHEDWTPAHALAHAKDAAKSGDVTTRMFADRLVEAAAEPDRCRCGHRFVVWAGLCSLCGDANEPTPDAA